MSEFMSYDPWAEITTRNGYAGDEMVAMLQKAIRRGKEAVSYTHLTLPTTSIV